MNLGSFKINRLSIRSNLILVYICIILFMIIGFVFSFQTRNALTNQYKSFMMMNKDLTELSILIDETGIAFDEYTRNIGEEQKINYEQHNQAIDDLLAKIRSNITLTKPIAAYLRILDNMQDYQKEFTTYLFNQNKFSKKDYTEIIYMKSLFNYMNSYAQLLSNAYLERNNIAYNTLIEKSKHTDIYILMIILISSVVGISVAFALSRGIVRTIHNLSKSAVKLSHANWKIPDLPSNRYTELQYVSDAFNLMKHRIIEHIEKIEENAITEKLLNEERIRNSEINRTLIKTQLQSLQMQINPHFLFNTLNMVNRSIRFNESKNAIKLIESISEILRYSLENKGKLVPISKEIQILKAYSYIQQLRFYERMKIIFDTPIYDSEILIPPLLLQPMVENAIVHGLSKKRENGVIKISVNYEECYTEINIEDNGIGMSIEKINSILEVNLDSQEGNIGINNVKKRLELLFNEENLLTIQSKLGYGTRVIIKIPKKDGVV